MELDNQYLFKCIDYLIILSTLPYSVLYTQSFHRINNKKNIYHKHEYVG